MRFARTAKSLVALFLALTALQAQAWTRLPAVTFATLPAGTAHPEGITADDRGNLYVANFDVGKGSGPGDVLVFDRAGKLLRHLKVMASSALLLGLAFPPHSDKLLVIDFGNKNVLRVDPLTGESEVFATIPGGAAAGPNALAFDGNGNVYISDSFQGTIWRKPLDGNDPLVAWVSHPLLTTTGVPPFGANGIAFNNAATALFVANTGNDSIVRIPLPDGPAGTPGTPEVFVNSINGADGLIVDEDDNLWVAANQADEIVVLDPSGRAIAKLGDFGGIDRDGSPRGLLFPASLVRVGGFIYVTNLALDLRGFGLAQTLDSQWAAQVTQHTIARIRARIPPVPGLCGSDDHGREGKDGCRGH